jgi:hypothetical protein
MSLTHSDRRAHWDNVYETKGSADVSWFQPEPELSLKLIRRTGISHDARIIDVGGGASTLVDHLQRSGFRNLTVLDIAAPGVDQAKDRLGALAERIDWIVSDVTSWRPPHAFDLWHDRAVLHFLTDPVDQAAYAKVLRDAVPAGGWVIIGGFAPNGPAKCSGLNVIHHDAETLAALLGPGFALMETHGEIHLTPQGREQAFRYHLFGRR